MDRHQPTPTRLERMVNRLSESSSDYLRQHAHQGVDWWEWSPEAQGGGCRPRRPHPAQHRLRVVPLVPRDEPRVVRQPRDRAPHQRPLRGDQGRPAAAARRRRRLHDRHPGHEQRPGWLAHDGVPDARLGSRSSPAPTSRPRAPAGDAVVQPGAAGDGRRLARQPRPADRLGRLHRPDAVGTERRGRREGSRPARGRRRDREGLRPDPRRLRERPEVPRTDPARRAAGQGRPQVAGDRPAQPRVDGPRRHLRPGRRRLPPLLGRPGLGGAALREDALRQRAPARHLRARLAAHRRPRRGPPRAVRAHRLRHRRMARA